MCGDPNVRSGTWLLLQSVGHCPHCQLPTALFCLGLPPGHETAVDDRWVMADTGVLLAQVEYLPPEVIGVLQEICTLFRPDDHESTGNGCWVNHCQHCGRIQNDLAEHGEPGGAFLPTTQQAAGQMLVVSVAGPFSARAGCFSDQFQLHSAMQVVG
jgi:hypothetical protein